MQDPSRQFSRRQFLKTTAVTAVGLPVLFRASSPAGAADAEVRSLAPYAPPASPRVTLNFNLNWTFLREDVPGAEAPDFDDTAWKTVSTPHSFNDVDSFRMLISHGGGDRGTYKGLSWYRKRFRLPAEYAGRNIFLEFEGMRQAGDIFLNGKPVGLYENGVNAYGIDLTQAVQFGDSDNVLAVKVDNRLTYQERATGTRFEWNANDFNPDHGGITRPVWLHVTGGVYQTLPLYYGLETTGVYVHAGNFNIPQKTADVTVESQVHNSSDSLARMELSAVIVDRSGAACAQIDPVAADVSAGAKQTLIAAGPLLNAQFWSPEDPALYDVYTIVTVNGKTVDVVKTVTGFRKTEFKGGAGTGGVYLNDRFVYLKGFAQRASNEWAGVGGAYPDWMHDYNAKLIRDTHANYLRWMHVSPQRADAEAMSRYGIIQICPAGDKEHDPIGRQWEQRVEVMRASMIYFRNNPSILFWEAGNTVVTVPHLEQMIGLRRQWDGPGGRAVGTRGNSNNAANEAVTPIAEYYGVMIGQDPHTDALVGPTAMFRGYSAQRRDRAPLIENEDYREECARRYWDVYSPPYFGFKKGPKDAYQLNGDTFALGGIQRYWEYMQNCISNTNPRHSKWSGYASIFFADSDSDGRQDSSEVARVSGKVDAVRLPKDLYFCHRVMQNTQPDLHILGHWSYPSGPGAPTTEKTVYVISNAPSVELFVNGKSHGVNSRPEHEWVFAFRNVAFAPGSLRAVGRKGGSIVAEQTLTTAGAPAQIRLTPIVGPVGLQADGQDIALIDVEVLDAQGQRCPTDDARVDFTCTGPAIWRGGYNSGIIDSTNNLYLNTELGINRVAVRSTLTPGTITVTASRSGLKAVQVQITSNPVALTDGLAAWMPPRLPVPATA